MNTIPVSQNFIHAAVQAINPVLYAKTRNYIDGAVTKLSPYISRGVISTKQILHNVLSRGYHPSQIEKFIQELAWRDYWQQVWKHKGDAINEDLKQPQQQVQHYKMPKAIIDANTGIEAIDNGIKTLYTTGYMHNHIRMYTASLAVNIAKAHWKMPAQWMYYYLTDADWASNALSWQWVAGTNSAKKYYANQENINKYCYTNQSNTFLDVGYDMLPLAVIPETLQPTVDLHLKTNLPQNRNIILNTTLPTCIYNFYNLDAEWKKDIQANRILLLEPEIFNKYPVCDNTVEFMLGLADNIPQIQIFTGSFRELVENYQLHTIYYKEHPLNKHYTGIEESRDWMFPVEGYYPSFFAYWKKCSKYLKAL